MATRKPGPQDLGRLESIDESRLDVEVVLWRRFGIIGPAARESGYLIVPVEDLDREFGGSHDFQLCLHIMGTPADDTRLERAIGITSSMQPRVYAFAHLDKQTVLVSEPVHGVAVVGAAPGSIPVQPLVLASQLADLLAKQHHAGVYGVAFDPRRVRFENGRYVLADYSHLQTSTRSPEDDVAALVDSLVTTYPAIADVVRATATQSAAALHDSLKQALQSRQFGGFALPPEPPFVGREAALAVLATGVTQAQIARPTAIVVRGERGVGKSRLLHEFAARQQAQGDVLVLHGAWQDQSSEVRSGLLGALEQLPRILPKLDPDERDDIRRRINRATGNLGAIVARSAPSLGAVLRQAEELPQLDQLGGDFSRHTAVIADVLKCLGTRQRPLLLVLDNAENIDANSSAVLDIITQVRPAHYTTIVLGERVTDNATKRLSFQHELIGLQPLTHEEVVDFVQKQLPGAIVEIDDIASRLLEATEGLPLVLGVTVRNWVERGRLNYDAGTWTLSPLGGSRAILSIRELIAARVQALSPEVRRIMLQIATLGTELRRDQVAAVSEITSEVVAELSQRGVLISHEGGLRFPHDTIREIVLESAPEADLRAAHRRAAEILGKQGAPVAQIVYHRDRGFDESTATPDEFDKLSRLHVEAGRTRLEVYDLERARWHLERALEHSHDPQQRSLAAEGLADVCLLQEDLETAVSLYTAIIATAPPATGVRVAAKAVQFLFSKSANTDAKMLGLMALEMAQEPTPTSTVGKLGTLLWSLIRSWLGECKLEPALREGLCRLYMYMLYIGLIDDPVAVPMYVARSHWIFRGFRTGAAAISSSVEGAVTAVLGWTNHADAAFKWANQVAHESKDPWAQGMVFHHWGGALLGIDRYAEGQDRLDDALAAFRETGDVSIALVAMFYKSLYGRDRESADTILGWIDEASNTARRNGKRSGLPPLQSLRLHVVARQTQRDVRERLIKQAEALVHEEMPGIERMVSHIQLAYAGLESGDLDLAEEQVRAAQKYGEEMGGAVPEFCQEVHLVAALFILTNPSLSRSDRKRLRRSVRKFHAAAKRAPRFHVMRDMLDMKVAIHEGRYDRARLHASNILTDFDKHENLHAARQAHRTLARLSKGDNVLAAAEHEKVARALGRRLGLADHVLLSDFSELGREVEYLALAEIVDASLSETRDGVRGGGMLQEAAPQEHERVGGESSDGAGASQMLEDDILDVWDLANMSPPATVLSSVLAPVRSAVAGSIAEERIEVIAPNPDLEISLEPTDLQLGIITILRACNDVVGSATIQLHVEDVRLTSTEPEAADMGRQLEAGDYLRIRVAATGLRGHVPLAPSFVKCKTIIESDLHGFFKVALSDHGIELTAHIPLSNAGKQASV